MPQVVIEINERTYTMECGEGQEEHLRRLARMVDTELARIREMAGPVGEIRLLIMAALVVADKVAELEGKVEALSAQLNETGKADNAVDAELFRQLMQAMEDGSGRLKKLVATAPKA